ncbi:helix-turn-helix domain-containing protein [Ralstonia solanacearum]|uniref:helix-turn-helix domain-containing protein n=1 Tax=Ralstonia solanacearum TaxID=305 RepID=UPI000E573345|nr:helix-turn-helix transcriptional regulator [Ralstonia solanacearum]AXW23505.1 transcriptional regulator [Ralstonia solanacearum]
MSVDLESFGVRLEEERMRLGLNKGEMAQAGNVSASAYGNYLRGERVPDLAALLAWAEAGADALYIALGQHLPVLLPPEEEMVLAGYRKLDAQGRAGVLALIGGMQPQAGKKVKKTRNEMVFHGSVGDIKNISGDYHETRHQTFHAESGKKKRTDKDD